MREFGSVVRRIASAERGNPMACLSEDAVKLFNTAYFLPDTKIVITDEICLADCNDAIRHILKKTVYYLCHLRLSASKESENKDIHGENRDVSSSLQNLSIRQEKQDVVEEYLIKNGRDAVVKCLKLMLLLLKRLDGEEELEIDVVEAPKAGLAYVSLRVLTSRARDTDRKIAQQVISLLADRYHRARQEEEFYVDQLDSNLRQLFAITLKDEDIVFQFERELKDRGMERIAVTIRYLVQRMNNISERCFSAILSLALSLVQDYTLEQRLDGVAIIGHCLDRCKPADVRYNGEGIIAALSDSLVWQDSATALASFPVLARTVDIVEPPEENSTLEDPSKGFSQMFERVVNVLITLIDAKESEKVSVASTLALHVVNIGKDRLMLYLRMFIPGMCLLLEKTASLNLITSTTAYIESCQALTEAIKWTWPRIPAYYEALIGSLLNAITRSQMVTEDENKRRTVLLMSAETLVGLRRCGDFQNFDGILGAVYNHPRIRRHLKPIIEVCDIVKDRVEKESKTPGTLVKTWPHGYLAQKIFPDGWPRVIANS
eukprot:Plantae.Rhodophyta-Hildenbrandia_rubra.ctg16536.p1 GENE.Plantae.Rhodophyta-Hildenbrandia_rubra.ctg16536~~Plantae.Rhodophyta-Hildenbrandia_rubra.ctg16536.p1  ORF type:complete len:547 (+),score=75.96 Plantae.Rhodophyta-Hildenbrandia_rubra.ctg16536:462-2102(+)